MKNFLSDCGVGLYNRTVEIFTAKSLVHCQDRVPRIVLVTGCCYERASARYNANLNILNIGEMDRKCINTES